MDKNRAVHYNNSKIRSADEKVFFVRFIEKGASVKNGYYEQEADHLGHIYLQHGFYNVVPAHFHNSIEILFVAGGKFVVRGNGEEKTLSAGDVFFADNFVTHLYTSERDSEFYVVVMSDTFLKNFRYLYGDKSFPMFITDQKEGIKGIIASLASVFEEWDHYNDLMKHGFADWLLGRLAAVSPPETVKDHQEGRFITKVLQFLDAHYADALTMHFVANRFGYSPNYFSTLFHRYTAMHFREYLNRVRLEKALAMQRADPTLSAVKAASACGFASLNTFYRTLKKNRN